MLEDFVILNIFVKGMISDDLYYNGSYMNLLIVILYTLIRETINYIHFVFNRKQ